MTRVFATRGLCLSRLAHLRAVRVLACLFAISLALGGYLAAVVPLHATMAAATSSDVGHGCGHDGMAMPAKHGHAPDQCCRTACACALVHAIGAVAPLAAAHDVPVSAAPAALPDAHAPVRANPPPLRPPIA